MQTAKRIHHIALLVDNIDTAIQTWKDILGIEPSRISDVPSEAARIAFLPLGESEIELVQPTTTDSGLNRFLEKHGPGMHHICFEVEEIYDLVAQLKDKGIQLINDVPRVSEDGRIYAFIHPKSTHGVLVELYQIPK